MKKALITGASSGIGAEFARQLNAMGYQLTLLGRSKERLQAVAGSLAHEPSLIIANLATDIGRQKAEDEIKAAGPFDVVISNAGVAHPEPALGMSRDTFETTINTNLLGAAGVIRAAIPAMVKRGSGSVIAVVSMGGIIALENYTDYSASKFGMRGFMWALANELKGTGVGVSGMYCSAVDTPMLRAEAQNPHGSPLNFMGKVSSPEEVVTRALKAIGKPELEMYVPYGDSWTARILGFFPRWLETLQPMFVSSGEKGRAKYLAKHGLNLPGK